MIRWCSYCQRFMGESPPYENLSVTHGICSSCVDSSEHLLEVPERIRAIAAFFREFLRGALRGTLPEPAELLELGGELGIRPVDLLIGVAQPTLYTIGRHFAAGLVSSEREHKLSQRVEALLEEFEGAGAQVEDGPRLLLGCAPGNKHLLGARIFALTLAEAGLRVDVIPHIDHRALDHLLSEDRYDCVGFSVALPGQARLASEGARVAKRAQPGVLTALGGCVTKEPPAKLDSFDLVADPSSSRDTVAALAKLITAARAPS